jgi:hypothetical protein
MPAPPEALAAFLAERAEAGLTFGTLDGYCSGIAHRHHQEGLADPTADVVVRRVRRGLRRIMGVAPRRQAHPLTVAELGQIVASIDTDTVIGTRDRVILLLGYASAMRPGEVSALNVEDLLRKPTGVLINIRRSKTDQDARGQLVGVARGDNRLTDPIRALDDWLKIRPSEPGALFTRVFYRDHPTNERIGPRAISRTVQDRAKAAGFDGIPVSGHSLRAGRHDRRSQRCPDRSHCGADEAPRPRHSGQPLHPARGGDGDHHKPRPRSLKRVRWPLAERRGPGSFLDMSRKRILYRVADQAIAGLEAHEVDPFRLELCLAMLIARCSVAHGNSHGAAGGCRICESEN